ncbi:hypothetical protein [Streptomyces sp. NPDC059247]|uniref:hypothetical protein n=1 Tax=Streptomyces sp. NPDC059247 TaxID=3346790 RepID=UPI00367732C9
MRGDGLAGLGVGVPGEPEALGDLEQLVAPGALRLAQGDRAEQSVEGAPVGGRERAEGVSRPFQPRDGGVGVEDLVVAGRHRRHQLGQGLGQCARQRVAHRVSPPGILHGTRAYRAV